MLLTGQGVPKLADVGIATSMKANTEGISNDAIGTCKHCECCKGFCGTDEGLFQDCYMAPEMLKLDTPYGLPVDIYALGCLLYEMMTLKAYETLPDALPEFYSEGLRFLCEKMLEKNPDDRPQIDEVCPSTCWWVWPP